MLDLGSKGRNALTAGGLHVTKGANLWEAFREFENAILAGLLVGT